MKSLTGWTYRQRKRIYLLGITVLRPPMACEYLSVWSTKPAKEKPRHPLSPIGIYKSILRLNDGVEQDYKETAASTDWLLN